MSHETGTTKILIVDDHSMVRDGLATLITRETDWKVIGGVGSRAEAMAALSREMADLVLVDLSLADGSGLELIKAISSREWPCRMLVISMHDEALFAERALRAGAHGFICKNASIDHLLSAIRSVLDGNVYLSPSMSDRLIKQMAGGNAVSESSTLARLTDRELEVFEAIGRGRTIREIASNLKLSPKTVENHRDNIKAKLGLRSANDVMRHAVTWILCGEYGTGEQDADEGGTPAVGES